MEVEELEKRISSPTDTEDIIGVFAWSACDHEGRRRLSAVKRNKTTLVANVKRYAMMLTKQDDQCQELHEAIKYITERQGKLLAMMKRKREILQQMRVLVMKELLKERRSTEVEKWRERHSFCREQGFWRLLDLNPSSSPHSKKSRRWHRFFVELFLFFFLRWRRNQTFFFLERWNQTLCRLWGLSAFFCSTLKSGFRVLGFYGLGFNPPNSSRLHMLLLISPTICLYPTHPRFPIQLCLP